VILEQPGKGEFVDVCMCVCVCVCVCGRKWRPWRGSGVTAGVIPSPDGLSALMQAAPGPVWAHGPPCKREATSDYGLVPETDQSCSGGFIVRMRFT